MNCLGSGKSSMGYWRLRVENPGLEQIKKNFKAFGTGCPIIRCNKTPGKNVTG